MNSTRIAHDVPRYLIIHGDDLGMSHSINEASLAALETHAITSVSAMAPCPWLNEVADFVRAHPQTDVGLHLTLTSECPAYRWRPLSATAAREGLVDGSGYLHGEVADLRANAREIGDEARCQFQALKSLGIGATHLDCHMMASLSPPRLLEGYLRAASAEGTPALIPWHVRMAAEIHIPAIRMLLPRLNVVRISPFTPANEWLDFYVSAIEQLPAGISVMTVHLGFDTDELRAVRRGRLGWDAAWRRRDFDAITSSAFKDSLSANEIRLIKYGELTELAIVADQACSGDNR